MAVALQYQQLKQPILYLWFSATLHNWKQALHQSITWQQVEHATSWNVYVATLLIHLHAYHSRYTQGAKPLSKDAGDSLVQLLARCLPIVVAQALAYQQQLQQQQHLQQELYTRSTYMGYHSQISSCSHVYRLVETAPNSNASQQQSMVQYVYFNHQPQVPQLMCH